MSTFYIGVFTPKNNGDFSVCFLDFPPKEVTVSSLASCISAGEELLKKNIQTLVWNKKAIPAPMTLEEVKRTLGEQGQNAHCQIFLMPVVDTAPVKVTVSLPQNLLALLDNAAKLNGCTRSGLVAQAIEVHLTSRKR